MNKTLKLILTLATIVFFAVGVACAVSGWTLAGVAISGIEPTKEIKVAYDMQKYENEIDREIALLEAQEDLDLALEAAGEDADDIAEANAAYDKTVADINLEFRIGNEIAQLEYEEALAQASDAKKEAIISVFVFDPQFGLKEKAKTIVTGGDVPINDTQIERSFRNPGLTTVGGLVVASFVFLLAGAATLVSSVVTAEKAAPKKAAAKS